jgi:short-subunit dehydrogenase
MPSTILITGAANGIGRRLATLFAADGDSIAALDRDAAGLESLVAEMRGRTIATVTADVTRIDELRAAVATLEQQFGPIDTLIANAGIAVETSAFALNPADFERVIDVNLIGVANSIAAVLPGMIQRQRGHLAALSSLASFGGLPRMLAYCASKSGVNALMEGLRAELRPIGVTTTTVCPGWIRTAMTREVAARLPNILELNDAAARIHAAIRAKKEFVAFPAGAAWQLRFLGWLPRSWRDRVLGTMTKRMKRAAPPTT